MNRWEWVRGECVRAEGLQVVQGLRLCGISASTLGQARSRSILSRKGDARAANMRRHEGKLQIPAQRRRKAATAEAGGLVNKCRMTFTLVACVLASSLESSSFIFCRAGGSTRSGRRATSQNDCHQ